uniref:TIL domain-containing protein n=1 Tax=Strongyloides papillosus TaxID=174720 RepID=A0A0N5CHV7_STREA
MIYQNLLIILTFYFFGVNASTNDDCRFACIQRCQSKCFIRATIPTICLNTCPTACASACTSYLYVNSGHIGYLRPSIISQTTTSPPLLPMLDSSIFKSFVQKYHEVKSYLSHATSHVVSEVINQNITANVCHSECLTTCEKQCDPDNEDNSNVCEKLCKPFCKVRCGILSREFDLFSNSACSSACAPHCNTVCIIKQGLKQLFDASDVPTIKEYVNEVSNRLDPNVNYVKGEMTMTKPKEIVENIKICVNQCVNRCARGISDQSKPFEKQISACHSPCENVCHNKKNIEGKKTCDILKCNQNCMYQCYGLKNKNINCRNICERTCESLCVAPDVQSVSSHRQMMLKVDTLYKLDIMKNDCFASCSNYSPRIATPNEAISWTDICQKSCTSLDYERKRIMNTCSMGCQGQCKESCLYSDKGYAQCDPICKVSCDGECGNKASKYKECEPNCLTTCNKNCKNRMSDFKCSISCYALCRNEACSRR